PLVARPSPETRRPLGPSSRYRMALLLSTVRAGPAPRPRPGDRGRSRAPGATYGPRPGSPPRLGAPGLSPAGDGTDDGRGGHRTRVPSSTLAGMVRSYQPVGEIRSCWKA